MTKYGQTWKKNNTVSNRITHTINVFSVCTKHRLILHSGADFWDTL